MSSVMRDFKRFLFCESDKAHFLRDSGVKTILQGGRKFVDQGDHFKVGPFADPKRRLTGFGWKNTKKNVWANHNSEYTAIVSGSYILMTTYNDFINKHL